jgi:hypothetical protein
MGEVINMHALEIKRQVRRRQYAVDVDAVAEAIVRRIVSRRATGGTEVERAGKAQAPAPLAPEVS